MRTVRIDAKALGSRLQAFKDNLPNITGLAMITAAAKAKSKLEKAGPWDTKEMRHSWKQGNLSKNATQYPQLILYNDAPHAGVIESGARAHGVSEEGQDRIREWIRRNLVRVWKVPRFKKGPLQGELIPGKPPHFSRLSKKQAEGDPEIERILGAILHKIGTKGTEGKFFVRDKLPLFAKYLGWEAVKEIKKHAEMAIARERVISRPSFFPTHETR